MTLIELHILQSFPITCLNRDDLGAPKTAYFGGCQRARVSSQSWKRAIRTLAKETVPDFFAGQRTRFLIRELEKKIQEHPKAIELSMTEKQMKILARATGEAMEKLDDPEKGNVKTLLYFSPLELGQVVSALLESDAKSFLTALADDGTKKKDKDLAQKALKRIAASAAKKLKNKVKDNADIAVFGRMVANDHSLMMEGAGLFSHALSTHAASNEIDFFSAVDDLNSEGDEGAGHIGTLEYNSACYYRYVGLNIDLLSDRDHLAHFSPEEKNQVITSFLKASIMAVPRARKNSMFGFNPPVHVLGLKRLGQPLSLVNAFETPVQSTRGYVEKSIDAMKTHWDSLKKTYNLEKDVAVSISMPDKNMDEFISQLV